MMAVKQSKTMPAGHTAGIFADMSLDGPEIGTLVAVIDRAKNLPNRKTMGKQDPYCAMRLGKWAKKTETDRRGGQTPKWDQELRFTVHDSPDYYKLKCSIFNDDKRTDLIGEVWIDLHELIIPGGGQNDLWHQLNFKGKYAGDIRMEMTYYDTRVASEPQAEKRKQRSKTHSNTSDGMSSASSSRQLGPREIKRRPLPPGPGQQSPSDMPAPLNLHTSHPQTPPYAHSQQHHQQWMPAELNEYEQNSYEGPPQTQHQSYNGDYDETSQWSDHNQVSHYDDSYSQPHDSFVPLYESQAPQHTPPPANYHDIQYDHSMHSQPSSPCTPPRSSPPVRQSPPAVPQDASRENRMSTSPTKYLPYRDSPLRQSVSQQEVPQIPSTFDPRYDELDAPPPTPAHRGSLPRPSGPSSISTPPQQHHIRSQPPRQGTIEDRSPLQMLEHYYNPQPASNRSSGRRMSHLSQGDQYQQKPVPNLPDAEEVGDFPAPHQLTLNYGVDFASNPVEQDQQGRYIRRNSFVEAQDVDRPLQRAHTFDAADVFDERNTFRSEPQVVKPRAVSPNAGPVVPRKSVSPHPYTPNQAARMNTIPFGPDSYDMLNPGSSPASHAHPTPEQARQTEVNKLRDQGPIIGNDGRVIDPSDHLPSDTWAPEPERKTRQPEHVIHVRRKNEPQRPDSSPLPVRPHSYSPHQSSPAPMQPSLPSSPYQPLPDSSSAPNSARRNRLQKQVPQRPLPTQPFPHAHSSPSALPQVRTNPHSSPDQQRNSLPTSPMSRPPQRPSLSEYQVPIANSYNPRNSFHPQQAPTRPPQMTPMPQRPQSFAYGGYDNSLAAEMSMIDIGPSRGSGGRTALRSSRGHNGY